MHPRRAPHPGPGRPPPLDERRLDRLFFACHSHARDIDGLHPGDSLDELCKMIALKIADEAGATATRVFPTLDGLTAAACARRVRALHGHLGIGRGGRRDPRFGAALWREPLALSDAALARIARELAPCALATASGDVAGRAFQSVLDAVARHGMGQFFTPAAVVGFMVAACAPRPDERIIDPFCGSGHILRRAAAALTARPRRRSLLVGVEKSARMARIAATEALVDDAPPMRLVVADSLTAFWVDHAVPGPGGYDLVMTNPPFGSLLRPEAIARLDRFALAGARATPLEVLGLERSIGLLRPGGRIAIVLPDGVLSGATMRPVRDWLHGAVTVRAVVSLPLATFQPFGAAVKTSIVFATRRRARPGDETWFATVDDIGHDGAGRARPGSELPEALAGLRRFIARRGW
ncbi:MAG TPA: N-6 DNA methylase [Planctomycetota bacterium]|nr:N-6 DNA methylase [Planctomycetota bacterium]